MPSPLLLGRRLTPFAPASAPEKIDKMLIQFEGREDKLVETLRTMHEWNVAQRARAAVQKTANLEARANASISSASELSGDDSDSSGEALGWSTTKCSDTTSSKPFHYGSGEDSCGDNYRSSELSVKGGGGGKRGGGGDWRRRRRRQRRQW